jgi:hypothetical protein
MHVLNQGQQLPGLERQLLSQVDQLPLLQKNLLSKSPREPLGVTWPVPPFL